MHKQILAKLDEIRSELEQMSIDFWENPEIAFEEIHASNTLREYLKKNGFTIREIPNNPTSFVAEYGSGRPILGITGEYDALPKQSQKRAPKHEPDKTSEDAGHGCGHNLLGVAGAGAAVALRDIYDREGLTGTLRFYGCAAEETLAGKGMMAREGVFDDLDACLTWHPSFLNSLWNCSFLAMNSLKFRFKGIPAHAAAAPEAGRSALDAVELMNVGANFMREHVTDPVRIHYTITNGGGLPNTVPADAEVWYYVRAPKRTEVRETTARLVKIAQGAALMTETEMSYELLAGCYDVIPNQVLGELMVKNMKEIGGTEFDEADYAYADQFTAQLSESARRSVMNTYFAPGGVEQRSLSDQVILTEDRGKVMPGSTDVGDVSYITPLAQITAACWPVGVVAHAWMATACTGTSIGMKGMFFAARTLALSIYDLFKNPDILADARKEFKEIRGDEKYVSAFDE
ncbi:MAG: amidohydrolase [Bacillota bacterium]|nr:amidohydrolase [Bacillota bacterium]